ncbi:MAG: phenyltransferase domain-containing protein [Desulfobacteraceae bacterium]|nr:phenyltransferase domain-containing protein [Desulfobacteraceae bacterium]
MPLLKTENRYSKPHDISLDIPSLGYFIANLQNKNGEIPWHKDGKTDPWDLVESAMGLNVSGYHKEAKLAFEWMKTNQNSDGSWYSSYMNGEPLDRTRESNMSSYIATGLFHSWLIIKDTQFLKSMWQTLKNGIDFAISLQTDRGEIFWAKSPEGKVDPMALLTGSSSVFMSLKCAISIGLLLDQKQEVEKWEKAFKKLQYSIQKQSYVYNISKSRYSMYWFYPVLSGALVGLEAEKRIEKKWNKYVVEGLGARCVSDNPWITIAETAELILSLEAMGKRDLAMKVFSWIQDCTYDDNTYWCGYTFPDNTIWPEQKISWTNAVVMMAADALYSLTPASNLFSHKSWDGYVYTQLIN